METVGLTNDMMMFSNHLNQYSPMSISTYQMPYGLQLQSPHIINNPSLMQQFAQGYSLLPIQVQRIHQQQQQQTVPIAQSNHSIKGDLKNTPNVRTFEQQRVPLQPLHSNLVLQPEEKVRYHDLLLVIFAFLYSLVPPYGQHFSLIKLFDSYSYYFENAPLLSYQCYLLK
jgi:hypothetical protein